MCIISWCTLVMLQYRALLPFTKHQCHLSANYDGLGPLEIQFWWKRVLKKFNSWKWDCYIFSTCQHVQNCEVFPEKKLDDSKIIFPSNLNFDWNILRWNNTLALGNGNTHHKDQNVISCRDVVYGKYSTFQSLINVTCCTLRKINVCC